MTKTAIALDHNASKEEAAVARRLVRKALEAGYKISVNDGEEWDGEEWVVKRSTNRDEILAALASTGEDSLCIYDANEERLGNMWLMYQNGPGDELIYDHTDNETMEALYRAANKEG